MTILRPSQDIITGGWQGSPPSIVTSKQVWRQQPQTSVEIDWSNPLTRGLVVSYVPKLTVLPDVSGTDTGLISAGSRGVAYSASGSGSREKATSVMGYPSTIFRLGTIATSYGSNGATSCVAVNGNAMLKAFFMSGGSVDNRFWMRTSTNALERKYSANATVADGRVVANVGVFKAYNNLDVYWNGLLDNGALVSGDDTNRTFNIVSPQSADGDSYFSSLGTKVYAFYVWNRAISATEVASISANPWQIFQKKSNTTYFLPPLYDTLNESTYSDADYIATSTAGDIARVSLGTYADAAPSIILKRDVWTSQPQTAVGIDWSNPLTKNLAVAWSAATPKILHNGKLATTDNTTKTVAKIGQVVDCSTGQVNIEWGDYQPIITSDGAGTGDFTMSVFANPYVSAGANWEHVFAQKNDAAGTPYAQAALLAHCDAAPNYESGAFTFFTYSASSGGGNAVCASSACDGKWHLWSGVRKGNVLTLYKDGVALNSATVPVVNISQSNRYLALGSRGNGTTEGYRDQLGFAAGFNCALSPAEIKSLSDNPHQIFRKQPKPIFITPPRGTHSLKYRAASPEADRGLIARVLELGQPPAIILKRDIWTSQPQVPVGIDWGNPLAAKLLHIFTGSINNWERFGGALNSISASGVGVSTTATSGVKKSTTVADSSPWTVAAIIKPVSFSASNERIISTAEAVSNDTADRSIGFNSSYKITASIYDGATKTVTDSDAVGIREYRIVATCNGTTLDLYVDGKLKDSVGVSNTGFAGYTTPEFLIGGIGSGSFLRSATIPYVLKTLKSWDSKDVVNWNNNPWQIFRKQPKPIFIDAPKVIASQTKTAAELSSTALILKRDIWTSQPQTAVGIDWSNPLTKGLVYSNNSATCTDVVMSGSSKRRASSGGIGFGGFSTASDYVTYPDLRSRIGSRYTLVFILKNNTSGNQGFGDWSSQSDVEHYLYIGDVTLSFASLSRPSIAANYNSLLPHALVGAVDANGTGNNIKVYCAGKLVGTLVSGGTTNGLIAAPTIGYSTGFGKWDGEVYGVLLWNRQLSASEGISISLNPWQIFKKQPKPLYFDLGPNEHNLTLSSEETSSITDNSELALEVEST